jgi:hypothetical protein
MDAEPDSTPRYPPPPDSQGAPTQPVLAPVGPVPNSRDQQAYAALLTLLSSSGAFQDVIFGDALQRSRSGADGYPLAVVTPRSWEESDDFDPVLLVRRVSFTITVVVKGEDGGTQFDVLDGLASALQGVVDHSDLGGTSLAALTKIRSGRYGQATHHPEQSIELDGSFTTLIDPPAILTAQ